MHYTAEPLLVSILSLLISLSILVSDGDVNAQILPYINLLMVIGISVGWNCVGVSTWPSPDKRGVSGYCDTDESREQPEFVPSIARMPLDSIDGFKSGKDVSVVCVLGLPSLMAQAAALPPARASATAALIRALCSPLDRWSLVHVAPGDEVGEGGPPIDELDTLRALLDPLLQRAVPSSNRCAKGQAVEVLLLLLECSLNCALNSPGLMLT